MADSKISELFLVNKTSDHSGTAGSQAVRPGLKTAGIQQLKLPGTDSNYLDWKFVMAIYLQSTHVLYVLETLKPVNRPASWEQDNISVCSVITRTVHPANYCYICKCPNNAATMWAAIKEAHQDLPLGGCMFWL